MRSSGSGGNTAMTIEHPLADAQIAAGALDVVWTFDVDNGNGGATATLFIEGVQVATMTSDDIGADWSGTDGVTFAESSPSFAAAGDNVALDDATAFDSGSIDFGTGLALFSGKLFNLDSQVDPPLNDRSFQITRVERTAAGGVLLEWANEAGATYAVSYSDRLESDSWTAIALGIGGDASYEDNDATRIG